MFVSYSTGFELPLLMHCNTNSLGLGSAPVHHSDMIWTLEIVIINQLGTMYLVSYSTVFFDSSFFLYLLTFWCSVDKKSCGIPNIYI